jgi:hypothetical protein
MAAGLVLFVAFMAADSALAFNWTATGSFKYQDREFDINGFTGLTPALPIRFAKVEVRYKQGSGSNLLATGFTDASGNYSVQVLNDTTVRDILIRVITTSGVADLFLQVTNVQGQTANYAVSTPFFLAHQPSQNLNAGNFTAVLGAGAEAFNVWDVALNSVDYLAYLNGSRPGSSMALKLQWEEFGFVGVNQYIGSNTVRVADNSPFNDTVIQHETGHYAVANFSASDNPGGVHHLTNCKQDLRLAFDEGHATYFGQSVRRHFNLPRPHLYVKMNGAPGPGNLDFYFDVEDEQPFTCTGSASEVAVYAALWDIGDSATTPDDSPGLDEAWDPLGSADAQVWDVMRNYLPSAANKSIEDFWDGWFIRSEGLSSGMISVFLQHGLEFVHDASEPNELNTTAKPITSNGIPLHASYFKDQGNGAGTVDTDYFKFDAIAGQTYSVETTRLVGDANTSLVLYATDGTSMLFSNDDRNLQDKSSLITFTAPVNGTYFVKSFHGPGFGIYGSYDIAVSGGSTQTGGGAFTPSATTQIQRKRSVVDTAPAPTGTGGETSNNE